MSTIIAVEDIKISVGELIDDLVPGQEVILTRNQEPIAKLVAAPPKRMPRKAGSAKGKLSIVVEDDEHLHGSGPC